MNDELDALLESELLTVPPDFTGRVMREVHANPARERRHDVREWLQWLAVIGGAAFGAFEVLAFVFATWSAMGAS